MRAYSPDGFTVALPAYHRFPMRKYAMLRERVVASGVAQLCDPPAASDEEILRAHSSEYLGKLEAGGLTRGEEQALGLPWSPQLVLRARYSVGSTLAACRSALSEGIAVSLAGGTHHAHRDRGEGYCVFNDGAIAARTMQAEGRADRVLIVDCDVHQGDGTAAILEGDESVFTFSVHAAGNYPFTKQRSDLDVALPDGTGDTQYMDALAPALEEALARADADLVIYLAGADPYAGDRLGKLSLSKKGLVRRDRHVLQACCGRGLAVAVTMGGGYAEPIEDTVEIYHNTVKAAARSAAGRPSRGACRATGVC